MMSDTHWRTVREVAAPEVLGDDVADGVVAAIAAGARVDAGELARGETVAAVEENGLAADRVVVQRDGLEEPVRGDVRGELVELGAGHEREQLGGLVCRPAR
jgi:hypothetical protein